MLDVEAARNAVATLFRLTRSSEQKTFSDSWTLSEAYDCIFSASSGNISALESPKPFLSVAVRSRDTSTI